MRACLSGCFRLTLTVSARGFVNPRLIAIAGPQKKTAWTIADGPLSLGRDATNRAELRDPAVSRKHCSINEVSPGIFEIADLDSHNGTLVNGTKVSRQQLVHGDRIRVGTGEFVFLTGPGGEDSSRPSESEPHAGEIELKTISLDRSGLLADPPGLGRMARDLSALFKIANVINSTRDVDAMQRELLALICEVIPASHAAIVLQTNDSEEGRSPCTWSRDGSRAKEMAIQDGVVQQAMWERCAVLASLPSDSAAPDRVMCMPLVAIEKILGVIYLVAPGSGAPFGEDHAFFLSSVSRIAAVTLENLFRLDSLRAENQRLRAEVKSESALIGDSRPMKRVAEFISRVAKSDSTVLVRGESGTGKELVARALHVNSPRSGKPFVAINCAAIPEALLESELFGHEKGAFTGAVATKKGKLDAAEDGTLFLDEIGDMAPLLQTKLLRVLQQREFERLGGNRLLPFNARVVAATNRNLEQAIKDGGFRQDLYYRLNVVSISLPPLREHREDIPLLSLHFAEKYSAKSNRIFRGIASDTRSLLMQYSWPGNVRQLENAIEHAIVMGLTDEILPEDLPDALLEEQSSELPAARYHNTINQAKKQLVVTALDEAGGSPVDAARVLGIHPKYLHRLIRNLNLKSHAKRLKGTA